MNRSNIKLSPSEKLSMISGLSKMLAGGIAIPDAIDALLEDAKKNQKIELETLKADLGEGRTIAQSLSKFPKSFDVITTNLIKTAEKSGDLEKSLDKLSKSLRTEIELSGKIKAAIAYPIFVVFIFFTILTLILTFVIPKIAIVFARLKIQLPLPTKILIFLSTQLRENTLIFLSGIAIFIIIIIILFKKKNSMIMNLFANAPIFSNLATQIDLARFTSSLGLMLSSSIPINEALVLTKDVVHKNSIRAAIGDCQKSIESGKKISEALKKFPKTIPAIMVSMVEAGEKSGSLENTLLDLSTYFQEKIDNSIKTLTILLEPVLLAIIGVLVGAIMLSIVAPIYSLIGQISPR